ncbi:DUF4493 domain-containing protein [uncultured Bacteroides sp.]|uniref:DUF4493 domain-containing protein n=1 Tax=uncultured Bacteroides sp. TaxID=162156 RepID=UPI002608DA69|nr:DUF4493 domain-containing protein [uncultured Bacteroides sp.]
MNRIERSVAKILLCFFSGVTLFSCSSEENELQLPEGTGYVSLDLNTNTGFQSRAVVESDYQNKSNYTVQILKDGKVLDGMQWDYDDMPKDMIELSNGAYELKAFYGDANFTASRSKMYVEGKSTFNINSDQVTASVTCKPVCGKVTVNFDSEMAKYFNDYSITFKTKALGDMNISWAKDDTEPIYMKVENNEQISATYSLVDTEGKSTTIDKTYSLSPQKHLIIKVVPTVSSGDLGITIVVDESTNDQNVDIVIPSDWI